MPTFPHLRGDPPHKVNKHLWRRAWRHSTTLYPLRSTIGMQAQTGNEEPKHGTPQGAACPPLALEEAMKAATTAGHDVLTKEWWAYVRARSTEKPKVTAAPSSPVTTATESTTTTADADAKTNEATAIKPKDDERDAIIAALKSRQIDRIAPYLPDGEEPLMFKILDLEKKYGIYHDLPSSSDDDSEEYIPPY